MQFYFIRHGQSSNNLLWTQTNSSKGRVEDAGLTEAGWRQAELLAEFLSRGDPATPAGGYDPQNRAGFHLTHLYTSLMLRAVMTGHVVAERLGMPLVAWEELHEQGGIYLDDEPTGQRVGQPGKNRAYFAAHYPRLVLPESLGDEGWWRCRPYEEPAQARVRAAQFLRDLLARHGHSDDRVAVFSHGTFYNYLLAAILKLPPEFNGWFSINNAAITRIDFHSPQQDEDQKDEIALVYLNRCEFLPRDLVT